MGFRRVSKKEFGTEVPGQKANKKIKSAKKIEAHGLIFDSRLELYMWEQLTEANINFIFKPKFILAPGFTYRGEKFQPVTLTSDFDLAPDHEIIIDPKGFANDIAPLKNKMLRAHLLTLGRQPRLVFPKSQIQCRELIFKIKDGFYLDPRDPKQKLSDGQVKKRIMQMRKIGGMAFDGKQFVNMFRAEVYNVSDIIILENWDFELFLQKIASNEP